MTINRNLSLFAQGTFASGGVSIGNTTDPGATNLSVTGSSTSASFIPTSATIPTNGMYYLGSNVLGFATNSTGRMSIDNGGKVQIGGAAFNGMLNILQATTTLEFNTSSTLASLLAYDRTGGTYKQVQLRGSTFQFTASDSGTKVVNIDNNANLSVAGTISPQQATTAAAPAYVKGAIYFDTTLNKLRVGGATAWETVTSV